MIKQFLRNRLAIEENSLLGPGPGGHAARHQKGSNLVLLTSWILVLDGRDTHSSSNLLRNAFRGRLPKAFEKI